MIIRDLETCRQSDRLVEDEHQPKGWDSTRMLLKDDGVGFSFHITRLFAGTDNHFQYKNHFEAVFIISGEGTIEDKGTGEVHELKPGSLYVLDKHDKHAVRPKTDMEVACCFNPPVTGRETHDADGSYVLVD